MRDWSLHLRKITDFCFYLVFNLAAIVYSLLRKIETLRVCFVRAIYLPRFAAANQQHKVVETIRAFPKKPCNSLVLVFSLDLVRTQQLNALKQKVIGHISILLDCLDHPEIYLFFNYSKDFFRETLAHHPKEPRKEVCQLIENKLFQLIENKRSLNVSVQRVDCEQAILEIQRDVKKKFMEEKVMILQRQSRLPAKRREETPFVICFSEYPTVCGLDYPYLVGAEIAFNPSPLASMTHDLVESFRQFNIAEQRKGK